MDHVSVKTDTMELHAQIVKFLNCFNFQFISFCFIQDAGCNSKGQLSCQNKGVCLSNGFCECKNGYSGSDCSICIIKLFSCAYLVYLFRFSSFLVKGCNNEGLWSCLNEGICLSNGSCMCINGFAGPTCSSCNIIIKN